MISNPSATAETQGGVFVPDIPIMQVTTTTFNNVEKYVDTEEVITEVITNVNKFETTEITQIYDNEITIIEGSDNTAVLIVIIGVGILVLLALVFLARFFYNRMRAETAKTEQIIRTQQNLRRENDIKVVPREKAKFDGMVPEAGTHATEQNLN